MKSIVDYKDRIVGDKDDFLSLSKYHVEVFYCPYAREALEPCWCRVVKKDCPVDNSGNVRDCVRLNNEK